MQVRESEHVRLWARRLLRKTVSAIVVLTLVRRTRTGPEIDAPGANRAPRLGGDRSH